MKYATDTRDEKSRLEELKSFQILDTDPEQEYDEITEFASALCDTPIALISLLDEDRQWFKSHHGLDASETGRDISFCGHAIQQDDIFQIKDSLSHPDFNDNPLAIGFPNVVFYAGQPLKTENGHNLGTLCVIDHKPKELTQLQRDGLRVLAKQITKHLSLRKNNRLMFEAGKKLIDANKTISDSQSALVEQTKLATMGQISSGIAHEINNPLSIIGLTNQQIREHNDNPLIDEKCDIMENTCKRISGTIDNLLTLSKQSASAVKSRQNIHNLVEQSVAYYRQGNSNELLSISNEVDSSLEIHCIPISIVQVLYNLITNASDAVRGMSTQWIRILSSRNEQGLTLSIIDSGNGLSKGVADKVFEPFYSTKGNKGHGLGLTICQSLVRQQKGVLSIDVEADNTKFDLWLPGLSIREEKVQNING